MNDPEKMRQILLRLGELYVPNPEGDSLKNQEEFVSYFHPDFDGFTSDYIPFDNLEFYPIKDPITPQQFYEMSIKANQGVWTNIRPKILIEGDIANYFIKVNIERDGVMNKDYRMSGWYKFKENKIIEFSIMGDNLSWNINNNIEYLKQMVDSIVGTDTKAQLEKYLKKLKADGVIDLE